MSAAETNLDRSLVIGGSGMLGFEIVRQLAARGKQVRVLDLQPLPEPICEFVHGDMRNPYDLRKACQDVEVVFQTAAAVWDRSTPAWIYEEINVEGNRRVIDACLKLGIRRLVYTSTMDVVVEGSRPIVDGDESLHYPRRLPRDPYCRTKIVAEKQVLAANGPRLATCALRPVGIYGPRDRYHLGNVINLSKRGRFVRLGDGSARFSHVYSENAAFAHLLAAERLWPGSPVAGQAYFIADHYPASNLFDFMEPFLLALDLPLPRLRIPYILAMALASVVEIMVPRSNFSRFAVIQTCVDHTFVDGKAARELGYWPIISREEAFRRTLAWLQQREGLAAGKLMSA
ncbi:MAG: NAD-dependent epimerase/dehydratase family protein [Spirochaetaceae bacterium]|nr:MAG: NAD-dependent epimerase/dehydratase family protein [Spirochaetaceae bacterium]